ncbi:flavin reductase family protein [Chondromyces crocatus]|uniref:Nitrilotriacetate monooxygenase n=1 Tax=Chondromyces crocatus TaxID=52 RepID=A0A0K1EJV7_CHOCO|nr:flavin reductase family protein [Chondromyces crocatus]AKT41140.1 nitrilotriacetate monooxygenase [Chondromyces crocatus]
MLFDVQQLPPTSVYKLLTATIVPRPIAWVVTQSPDGEVNAAPFSFFNVFSGDPPVICIGVGARGPGHPKDTAANVALTGELVVNLVSEDLATQMNVTAIDFPQGVDELAEAGLTRVPSSKIKPPRIGESPVAFECVKLDIHPVGADNVLIIARVVAIHVRDDVVLDPARCHIDTPRLKLLGRMHGAGMYVRLTDLFEMPRLRLPPG